MMVQIGSILSEIYLKLLKKHITGTNSHKKTRNTKISY